MKRLKVHLSLLSMILFLYSCDDDGNNNKLNKLVGTWASTYVEFSNCDDPTDDIQVIDGMCGTVPCLVLAINSDGIYSVVINFDVIPETEAGTITISGNTIEICEGGGVDCQTFSYSVDGNTLTMVSSDDCDLDLIFDKQ
jgi:hypothetical protein